MMPSESRFQTCCPDGGLYVAYTLSKLWFSPMITITCLIGVVVAAELAAAAVGAVAANAVIASPATPAPLASLMSREPMERTSQAWALAPRPRRWSQCSLAVPGGGARDE